MTAKLGFILVRSIPTLFGPLSLFSTLLLLFQLFKHWVIGSELLGIQASGCNISKGVTLPRTFPCSAP